MAVHLPCCTWLLPLRGQPSCPTWREGHTCTLHPVGPLLCSPPPWGAAAGAGPCFLPGGPLTCCPTGGSTVVRAHVNLCRPLWCYVDKRTCGRVRSVCGRRACIQRAVHMCVLCVPEPGPTPRVGCPQPRAQECELVGEWSSLCWLSSDPSALSSRCRPLLHQLPHPGSCLPFPASPQQPGLLHTPCLQRSQEPQGKSRPVGVSPRCSALVQGDTLGLPHPRLAVACVYLLNAWSFTH